MHRDEETAGIFRVFHLGVNVPRGCSLILKDEGSVKEENGKLIGFDDSQLHGAINVSGEDRLILDIKVRIRKETDRRNFLDVHLGVLEKGGKNRGMNKWNETGIGTIGSSGIRTLPCRTARGSKGKGECSTCGWAPTSLQIALRSLTRSFRQYPQETAGQRQV